MLIVSSLTSDQLPLIAHVHKLLCVGAVIVLLWYWVQLIRICGSLNLWVSHIALGRACLCLYTPESRARRSNALAKHQSCPFMQCAQFEQQRRMEKFQLNASTKPQKNKCLMLYFPRFFKFRTNGRRSALTLSEESEIRNNNFIKWRICVRVGLARAYFVQVTQAELCVDWVSVWKRPTLKCSAGTRPPMTASENMLFEAPLLQPLSFVAHVYSILNFLN